MIIQQPDLPHAAAVLAAPWDGVMLSTGTGEVNIGVLVRASLYIHRNPDVTAQTWDGCMAAPGEGKKIDIGQDIRRRAKTLCTHKSAA